MIAKEARIGLTLSLAKLGFNEVLARWPKATVQIIEQSDGLFTLVAMWDNEGKDITVANTSGIEKVSRPEPPGASPALGALSQKYESNGDSGAIGWDSTGGYSYGAYQIATKVGTMAAFLDFLRHKFPTHFSTLGAAGGNAAATSGADSFKNAWRNLSRTIDFKSIQHSFIEATHYTPFASKVLNDVGLDLSKRTPALRDVAWSVAVQHGPGNSVFRNALSGKNIASMDDRAIIEAVYTERSHVEKYFSDSTVQVQASVRTRFASERAQALTMLT